MSGLQRRSNGVYYFRLRVPADLAEWFDGRGELRKSLKTKERRNARMQSARHVERAERTFALMRSGFMTDAEIKKLAADYLRDTLTSSDRDRLENGARVAYDTEVGHWLPNIPYQDLIEEPAKVLAGEPSADMQRLLGNFLEAKGIIVDPASVEYKKLLREVSRSHLEALRIDERRDLGDFSDPYHLAAQEPEKQPEKVSQGLPLSKLIELYAAEKKAQGRWTPKTEHEVTACLNVFVNILGDVDVTTLTRADLTDSLNKVRAIKVKNKPIEERTVKKHMTHMSSLQKWAVRNGFMVRNLAEGLAPMIKKAPSEERSTYSPDDLRKLVSGLKAIKEKDSNKPERYWIPLVGLFSGLRLDEICQLYREDVREVEGVWCFDVNREKDKKLKNTGSIRKVPIHSKLIELGFLEYFKSLQHDRLWPNIQKGRDGYAHLFGKWYQRFNRSSITNDRKKVFHSFRHNFTDGLKQAGVQNQVIAELVGHTTGSITAERYGKKFKAQVLVSRLVSCVS